MTSKNVILGPGARSIILSGGNWTTNGTGTSWLSTEDENASVTFTFDGSFISVSGSLTSSSSQKTSKVLYFLNGKPDSSFVYQSGGTLYTSPSLTQGFHNLTMALASNSSHLSIQNVTLTVPDVQEPEARSSSKHKTQMIVGIVIGILVIMSLIAGSYLFLRRRRSRLVPGPTSQGPLQANLPTSKKAFTSKHYSLHGITFSHSPTLSVDSLASLPQARRKFGQGSHGISSVDMQFMSDRSPIPSVDSSASLLRLK
ncbi:hypothetical protein K435DRAFT_842965 [Dendrothele bispora CBS 962.96]|uniref:Uncharacterized protein n=1 Tax=Dendrothele bispora (strain CBS 962.96) TaxID=1314807 RepID=A0A4S8LBJ8_DENBC|nr:hypothetical protein K435DRAFT_842965 [Dendrothele bispora CBS 962.96]